MTSRIKFQYFMMLNYITLPQYCQIVVPKARKSNEPLLSQAIWRDTILKHFACTGNVYIRYILLRLRFFRQRILKSSLQKSIN